MRVYCSLWDQAYCHKGLALYRSLVRHHGHSPFTLFILAMDMEVYWLLESMSLPNATVIPLSVVEQSLSLAPIRAERSWTEYCWTMASQLMEYVMSVYPTVQHLTYLDSDLFFFSDPQPIYTEMGDASIAIIPHRFARHCELLVKNGIYNVGWLTIRNDEVGRACLTKWARQCRDWCFHRNEDGKFADQGYLDTWPQDYGDSCCVIRNIGAGVAPWNLISYAVTLSSYGAVSVELSTVGPHQVALRYPVIFYHFHEFKNAQKLTNHPVSPEGRRFIYVPYIAAIEEAKLYMLGAQQALEAQRALVRAEAERA